MSAEASDRVDVVITAPAPFAENLAYSIRARTTLGAVVQLIACAQRSVVVAAPYIQPDVMRDGPLAEALKAAIDRDVVVDLVSTKENLNLPVVQALARRRKGYVRLFHPAFPASDKSDLGSHAKFCFQDEEAAYVGSANLTKPALGIGSPSTKYHFEMGLLLGGASAKKLADIWQFAVRFGIFVQI